MSEDHVQQMGSMKRPDLSAPQSHDKPADSAASQPKADSQAIMIPIATQTIEKLEIDDLKAPSALVPTSDVPPVESSRPESLSDSTETDLQDDDEELERAIALSKELQKNHQTKENSLRREAEAALQIDVELAMAMNLEELEQNHQMYERLQQAEIERESARSRKQQLADTPEKEVSPPEKKPTPLAASRPSVSGITKTRTELKQMAREMGLTSIGEAATIEMSQRIAETAGFATGQKLELARGSTMPLAHMPTDSPSLRPKPADVKTIQEAISAFIVTRPWVLRKDLAELANFKKVQMRHGEFEVTDDLYFTDPKLLHILTRSEILHGIAVKHQLDDDAMIPAELFEEVDITIENFSDPDGLIKSAQLDFGRLVLKNSKKLGLTIADSVTSGDEILTLGMKLHYPENFKNFLKILCQIAAVIEVRNYDYFPLASLVTNRAIQLEYEFIHNRPPSIPGAANVLLEDFLKYHQTANACLETALLHAYEQNEKATEISLAKTRRVHELVLSRSIYLFIEGEKQIKLDLLKNSISKLTAIFNTLKPFSEAVLSPETVPFLKLQIRMQAVGIQMKRRLEQFAKLHPTHAHEISLLIMKLNPMLAVKLVIEKQRLTPMAQEINDLLIAEESTDIDKIGPTIAQVAIIIAKAFATKRAIGFEGDWLIDKINEPFLAKARAKNYGKPKFAKIMEQLDFYNQAVQAILVTYQKISTASGEEIRKHAEHVLSCLAAETPDADRQEFLSLMVGRLKELSVLGLPPAPTAPPLVAPATAASAGMALYGKFGSSPVPEEQPHSSGTGDRLKADDQEDQFKLEDTDDLDLLEDCLKAGSLDDGFKNKI